MRKNRKEFKQRSLGANKRGWDLYWRGDCYFGCMNMVFPKISMGMPKIMDSSNLIPDRAFSNFICMLWEKANASSHIFLALGRKM